MKKLFILIVLLLWKTSLLCFAASVNLTAPNYLPKDTPCDYYSPEVRVDYNGLENQTYDLKIWLLQSPRLNPSPSCASSLGCEAGFCEKIIAIDNTGGESSTGHVSIVEDFNVYNYTEFDWVIRLYNNAGSQVAWTEQFTPGTDNRTPKLNNIGNKTGYVGNLLEFYITGSDSDGDALSYTAYNLPSGASFDSGTRRFFWIPSVTGTYSDIKFRVADNGEGNLYDDEVITITINDCLILSAPSSPSPSDSATDIAINSSLCWTGDDNATSYEVYLGTTCPPSLVGTTTSTCYNPSLLTPGVTYHWYVIAKNECGESRGPVSGCWSFTATCNLTGIPFNPNPISGISEVSVGVTLDWADVEEANSYNIYFGNVYPPEFVGITTTSSFTPNILEYDTTYYWKVESVNDCGNTQGPEWNFTTKCGPPAAPNSLLPINITRGVAVDNITLDWGDSSRASSYKVYFGDSFPLPLFGNTTSSSYNLPTLSYNTQYFWQIIGINDCGTTTGPIWEFTTTKENASNLDKAYEFLYETMDKSNDFIVYTEKYNISNHFSPGGWMGYISDITFDNAYNENAHSGAECIKITYNPSNSLSWSGIYWLYPNNNWGDISEGYDLTGTKRITFWAKGLHGGEKAEFKVGGVNIYGTKGPYKDSFGPLTTNVITLTTEWQQFYIDLTGEDLSSVIGGFCWVTNKDENPNGCTIFLDDIKYESFPNKLGLLESFKSITDVSPAIVSVNDSLFNIYTEKDAPDNHYYASGWMGDYNDITLTEDDTANPFEGSNCIRIDYSAFGTNEWAGIYWQDPANNWGSRPGGYNLTGSTKLTFWAKGGNGGEVIEFKVGGITGQYPDSIQPPATPTDSVETTLTSTWQQYTIPLTGKDLSRVIGGFCVVFSKAKNLTGCAFYLDNMRFEDVPSEIESYTILPDSYLIDVAEVYDNTLVLLALLARGTNEDLNRAKILADSLVYCIENDVNFTDGRLYKSYYASDLLISNGLSGPIDMVRPSDTTVHIGNMTWTMISLIAYYEHSGIQKYLDAAEKIGEWVHNKTSDSRCNGGYTGGYSVSGNSETKINWKSTEHNIDVYVAFKKLYQHVGGDWLNRALQAKNFVESMWNEDEGYFWTGTLDDGCTINSDVLPADVNSWGLMALEDVSRYSSGVDWVLNNCYTTCNGFEGFDFNNDLDGIWWEGTAHTVIALQMLSRCDQANQYLAQLRQAQDSGLNSDGKGIIAACKDGVSTGFDWQYFARLHIGATAWYAFAELGHNPYWQDSAHPTELCDGIDNNCDGLIDEECCLRDGDVNQDGNVTPADALLAFQHYLGMAQLDECQQAHADVNNDESVTPSDALCIFQKYLGLPSCLD